MSGKTITSADEEVIIDFVKSHEILYNVRHEQFRDSEAKNRLWMNLAAQMDKDCKCLNIISMFNLWL